MLTVPNSKENFRLLALDPGSTNLGFSLLEHTFDSEIPLVIKAKTFKLNTNDHRYKELVALHGDKVVRLIMLRDVVLELLYEHKPHAMIIESNYMGRFANGFAALVECVSMMRSALFQYDPFVPLYQVDPTTVKTNVGMKRIKGTTKDDVKEHLIKSNKVDWCGIDPLSLDEHTIDAVAIGTWYMNHAL